MFCRRQVKDNNAVGIADGAEAVGDDDPGNRQLAQPAADQRLGCVIKCTGRLVKKEDSGVACQGSGEHELLSLAAGESGCAVVDVGMKAHRHGADVPIQTDAFDESPCLVGRERQRPGDVFQDAAGKDFPVLHDGTDLPAQGGDIERPQVAPVIGDGPGLRSVQGQEHPQQG